MWRIRTRDENVRPPLEGSEAGFHASKQEAIDAADAIMRQQPHLKVLWIEGPSGERISPEQFAGAR